MKLYLHIGTEKTGSSHLQSMAAINRDKLLNEGVWFPYGGKLEHQMIQGEISDGNGQVLTNFIKKGNEEEVVDFLAGVYTEGKLRGANKVFVSNELLVLALDNVGNIDLLNRIAHKIGFKTIKYLLILRDPVDQALSLYKHRAKSGSAPSIKHWIAENYYYSTGLVEFLTAAREKSIDLTVRKYSPATKPLDKVLFHDWLDCTQRLQALQKRVNPSLTLSELTLIKKLKPRSSEGSIELYNRFLNLPKAEKASAEKLEEYCKSVISNYLQGYFDTWQLCNHFLPTDEQIDIPQKKTASNEIREVYQFSGRQLELISEYMADWGTIRFRNKLALRQMKGKLGKIKAMLTNN